MKLRGWSDIPNIELIYNERTNRGKGERRKLEKDVPDNDFRLFILSPRWDKREMIKTPIRGEKRDKNRKCVLTKSSIWGEYSLNLYNYNYSDF
jgi:hypothetical protein